MKRPGLEAIKLATFRVMSIGVVVSCAWVPSPTAAYVDLLGGKAIARALPEYCQMGECTISTIEFTDPIQFHSKGVLVRVDSQNWHRKMPSLKLTRGADTTAYVFCSKEMPVVIDEIAKGKFMLTFLAPNDASTYGHSNSTSMELYFGVCHSRLLNAMNDDAPGFAQSLGYKVTARDDQPTVDRPDRVTEFLTKGQ